MDFFNLADGLGTYKVVLSSIGLVVGLIGLWRSSEKSIKYSIKLSKCFGITTFFVGFVFIAIATGLPELAVAIASIWENVPQIAAGGIIGSNLIDVSLVLGLPAIILGTMNVKEEYKIPLTLMLIVTALVMAFVFVLGTLNTFYGFILIFLYVVSIWWLWKTKAVDIISHKEAIAKLNGKNKMKVHSFKEKLIMMLKLLLGLFFVMFFSKLSIDCSVVITRYFALSLVAIGATIFAIGTSLPELALTFQAARKKEYALAFGNSFGSVLNQATLILGVLSIGVKGNLNISQLRPIAPLMFLSYAIVAHSLLKRTKVGRQEGLGRKEGLMLLSLFTVHVLYYLIIRK